MLAGQDLHVRRCKAWWRGVSWAVGIRRQRQVLGEHHCQGRTLSAQLYLSMWYVSSRTCIFLSRRSEREQWYWQFYFTFQSLGWVLIINQLLRTVKNIRIFVLNMSQCIMNVHILLSFKFSLRHNKNTIFDNLYIIRLNKIFLCFENENFLWIVWSFLRFIFR